MKFFRAIRNLFNVTHTAVQATPENVLTSAPAWDVLYAELRPFEALVFKAAAAEGWSNMSDDQLVSLSRLATRDQWYTQFVGAVKQIDAEREALAEALYYLTEDERPLTGAELSVATCALALNLLQWAGVME